MEVTVSNQPLSFAATMEAEERKYAVLMAQAKSSLARIKEIGEGFGRVREEHDAREDEQATRARDLLSRIAAEGAESRVGEEMDISREDGVAGGEDHTMEGNEQIDGLGHMEEDDRMEGDIELETAAGGVRKVDGRDFPELMERAKKLLARTHISMSGADQAVPEGFQAQGAKEMWTEEECDAFWNSM